MQKGKKENLRKRYHESGDVYGLHTSRGHDTEIIVLLHTKKDNFIEYNHLSYFWAPWNNSQEDEAKTKSVLLSKSLWSWRYDSSLPDGCLLPM